MGHEKHHNPGPKHSCVIKAMQAAIRHLTENIVDDVLFMGIPVTRFLDWMVTHDSSNHPKELVKGEVKEFLREHEWWDGC